MKRKFRSKLHRRLYLDFQSQLRKDKKNETFLHRVKNNINELGSWLFRDHVAKLSEPLNGVGPIINEDKDVR